MAYEQPFQSFLSRTAIALVAGQLTSSHLRTAIQRPEIRLLALNLDLISLLIVACESIQPTARQNSALMLEIKAADRRIRQLAECHQHSSSKNIA